MASADQATFRGVPFLVENAEFSGGRRLAKHEYPFRNQNFDEDMGRKSRGFNVEGFVIGSDWQGQRDALITALESDDGPGELVHPYYGTRRVAVSQFRVRESWLSERRVARFSIEFDETPSTPAQPTAVPDASGAVADSASAAQAGVAAEFLATYTPGTRTESLSAVLTSATTLLTSLVTGARLAVQDLASVNLKLAALQGNLTELINTPSDLSASLVDLIQTFGAGSEATLFALYNFNPGVRPPATTSNRLQEQKNFDALQRLLQRLAVIQLAALAPSETYDNFDAAVNARNAIADLLDDQAQNAADDTYPSLFQLRADLIAAVPGADSDLPRILQFGLRTNVPSIVLAYSLYGDLDSEADLVARNDVADPFSVPAGTLEILSRA